MDASKRIEIVLGPSRTAFAALAAAHAIALVAGCMALDGMLALACAAALAFSARRTLRLHALRNAPAAVSKMRLHPDGAVELSRRDARTEQGRLAACSTVHPYVAVVCLAGKSWRPGCSVIVPRDCVGEAQHRQLRVWMRWSGAGAKERLPKLS